ncbi:hypothetical protein CU102_00030 [Phyllobacterium brassicacearum]|uniref:Uncharacterized protein n=1 Tax=Phyllobacterium brassicacearum TaxID=314235 RepID=A0A2P7BVJ8_9HYPH|nr:hypothetical protein [Phyllobacterium brassicacearum]PSH70495.1 hypothetical protein CU102_00030 [Phyllobacterium brassicacearum]TDQ36065.1 hypothetical protein DEV91_101552 [Phyllobacterium brassicacearum]
MRALVHAAIVSTIASVVYADTAPQFPNATETNEQLTDLWRAADNACKHRNSEDVRVAVGCLSRSIYGAALNERGVCLGKDGQSNADMQWHKCEKDSLRFPPFTVPSYQ